MSVAWYDPRIARGTAQQLTRWHQRLKAGDKAIGWKLGFGTSDALERLKLGAPLVGYLTQETQLRSGEPVSLAGYTRALAECEVAVYLGKEVHRGATRDAVLAAIAGIAPAIEVVDLDASPDDVTAILAGNIYHRHFIVGARETNRGGLVEGYSGTIRHNGESSAVERLHPTGGDYVELVKHVADLLAAFGERLSAGQVIITGAVVPPLAVQPGDSLGFKFHNSPEITARFTA